MTFIDAIDSGRPFKRPASDFWKINNTVYVCHEDDHANTATLRIEDILATDWEVKEEPKEEFDAMPNGFKPQVASQAQLKIIDRLEKALNTHVRQLLADLKGVEDRLNKDISDLNQAETDSLNVINQLVTRDADLSKRVSDLDQWRENTGNVVHQLTDRVHDLAARVSKLERGECAEK